MSVVIGKYPLSCLCCVNTNNYHPTGDLAAVNLPEDLHMLSSPPGTSSLFKKVSENPACFFVLEQSRSPCELLLVVISCMTDVRTLIPVYCALAIPELVTSR